MSVGVFPFKLQLVVYVTEKYKNYLTLFSYYSWTDLFRESFWMCFRSCRDIYLQFPPSLQWTPGTMIPFCCTRTKREMFALLESRCYSKLDQRNNHNQAKPRCNICIFLDNKVQLQHYFTLYLKLTIYYYTSCDNNNILYLDF